MQVLASWSMDLVGDALKRSGRLVHMCYSDCIALAACAKMMIQNWAQFLLTVGVALADPLLSRQYATDDFQANCAAIASKLEVENATVYFSQFVAAGQNLSIPDRNATCGAPYQAVPADLCRIALYVSTSNSSGINMEAWLP
jgi:feruloyl esterase